MKYELFFDRPSSKYDEALPIGTGRLGAMVNGAVAERQIWINEETVWYGGPRDRVNPDASSHIGEIKRLVKDNRIKEAERLAIMTLTGVPESQRHYTTLGMVVLSFFNHNGEVKNYDHRLNFETATSTTRYEMDGVTYGMDVHANEPDAAIIIRLKSSAPVLDFFAGIERGERVAQFSYGTHQDDIIRHEKNGVIMTGSCGGKKGLDFAGAIFGESNGKTYLLGDKVVIKGASEAVLYVTAGTNYKEENVVERVIKQAVAARKKSYETCYQNHLAEWTPLYRKATISIESTETFIPPAMNRLFDAFECGDYSTLEFMKKGQTKKMLDDYLVLLLFHFGRYILLSCSRKCELPASLQGIWCRDLLSVWDGKYTTNINLQMAYWPADSANMSDCFEPYIRHAERIRETGLVTAKRMYNCRGFVLHNNTDIWADTAVQDSGSHCSYWFVGGVWMAVDMFEHFRYTQDRAYLRRVWPIMRDAALFVLDFMEEREDGKMVMGVTTSPENFYYDEMGNSLSFCQMCAMDTELITLLFNQCIEAVGILTEAFGDYEADKGFLNEVKSALSKIEPPKIGNDGTILEWAVEVKEVEPAHRHSSHVIGAYPYNNITERQPELLEAVEKSIEKRIKHGGCNTGWGRGWGAGLMARLKRGDDARDMFDGLLQYSGQPNLMNCCNIGRSPKLLDTNKPMQVDGTIGMVQGVVELLLQSYNTSELLLLPALPASWETGSFRGLVARGNIVVDAAWKGGKLTEAVLMPRVDTETTIVYKDKFMINTPEGQITSNNSKVKVRLVAGTIYHICRV